jgi:hypothetical protein
LCDILQEQYLWERFGSLRQLLASAIAALFIHNIVAKMTGMHPANNKSWAGKN